MKLLFKQSDKSNWGDHQQVVADEICKNLNCQKDWEVQIKISKPALDLKFPHIFYFRQTNKDKLMDIRASVGKELTRRIQEANFDDFKVIFAPAEAPSDNQRAYYKGVVLPTIQEHFKREGNFMDIDALDEAIRNAIEQEEGLFTEKVNPITGELYKARLTISNAGNKANVMKYIDAVIRFAAGHGIEIESPPEK